MVRWGARTLDLDLLLYGQMTRNDPWFILPHPACTNEPSSRALHDIAESTIRTGNADGVAGIRSAPSHRSVGATTRNRLGLYRAKRRSPCPGMKGSNGSGILEQSSFRAELRTELTGCF